jgi:hypothetical protein
MLWLALEKWKVDAGLRLIALRDDAGVKRELNFGWHILTYIQYSNILP